MPAGLTTPTRLFRCRLCAYLVCVFPVEALETPRSLPSKTHAVDFAVFFEEHFFRGFSTYRHQHINNASIETLPMQITLRKNYRQSELCPHQ